MSSVIANSRSRRGPTALYAVAAVVVVVAVVAVVIGMQRPVEVTVDGKSMTIDRGTTVAELAEQKAFSAPKGDLISVKKKVLKRGAGGAPAYFVNGEPVQGSQVVYTGDQVTSTRGKDMVEKVVIKKKKVDFDTVEKGKGPIGETVRAGVPGVEEVRQGAVSGIKVSSRVVTPPVDEIVSKRAITKKDKIVALTFDDGPWPHTTRKILSILDKENVKATFFMLGARVRQDPRTARAVRDAGHTIGNHSLSHRYLAREKSMSVLRTQVAGGQREIKKATGITPIWYRPAGGSIDKRGWKVVKAANLKVVMWDVDSQDWTKPGVGRIERNVVKNVDPGDIVLMHDGGGKRDQTVAALPRIIKDLKKKGYQFVTLDELAGD